MQELIARPRTPCSAPWQPRWLPAARSRGVIPTASVSSLFGRFIGSGERSITSSVIRFSESIYKSSDVLCSSTSVLMLRGKYRQPFAVL